MPLKCRRFGNHRTCFVMVEVDVHDRWIWRLLAQAVGLTLIVNRGKTIFIFHLLFKKPLRNACPLNNPLSITTKPGLQLAGCALTRCHEPPCYLVLGTPLLSPWWIAISHWSKATFVTSMGVPTSQIGMPSTLKISLPNHNRLPLCLSSPATTVRLFIALESI